MADRMKFWLSGPTIFLNSGLLLITHLVSSNSSYLIIN